MLMQGAPMRWLLLLSVLTAGDFFVADDGGGGGGGGDDDHMIDPVNTCGFGEGRYAVACTEPGRSCQIVTWEHDCDCSCGSDGWWYCLEGTIGSRCPQGAPDAGVPEPIPDAAVDAGACQSIEAESVGVHTGWFDVLGPPSGGKGLSSTQANVTFTFQFTGTSIDMTYLRGPTSGQIAVSIDGGAPSSVAAQDPTYAWTTAPLAPGLANTQHSVTVTCISPQCSLDVFPVTCN